MKTPREQAKNKDEIIEQSSKAHEQSREAQLAAKEEHDQMMARVKASLEKARKATANIKIDPKR
jgi:hypothetical protein